MDGQENRARGRARRGNARAQQEGDRYEGGQQQYNPRQPQYNPRQGPRQWGPRPMHPQQGDPYPQQGGQRPMRPQQRGPRPMQPEHRGPRPLQPEQRGPPPAQQQWGPRPSQPRQGPPRLPAEGIESGEPQGATGGVAELTRQMEMLGQSRRPRRGALGSLEPERVTRHEGMDKRGKSGSVVKVATNLFKFQITAQRDFQQYHISFEPPVESGGLKRKLIDKASEMLNIKGKYVTDGMQLFSSVSIDDSLLKGLEVNVQEGITHRVNVQLVSSISSTSPTIIQMLNIIFRNIGLKGCGLTLIGRNFFRVTEEMTVGGNTGLGVMPGYTASILEYDSGVRLMLDVSHKVVSKYTVLDYADGVMEDSRLSIDQKMKKIRDYVIGKIVMTGYNNRTYRIDDIDMKKTPRSSFESKRGGEPITFKDYYKERHGIELTNMNQPLLLSRAKRRDIRAGMPENIYLVPELCLITGISEDTRSNFNAMKSLSAVTKLAPSARVQELERLTKDMIQNEKIQEKFRELNIEMSADMVTLNARTLPQVVVQTGKSGPSTWNDVTRNRLIAAKSLKNWVFIYPGGSERDANKFLGMFDQTSRSMGMEVMEPVMYDYRNEREIPEIIQSCSEGMELMMIVLKYASHSSYSAIKRHLCYENPVLTQVLTGRVVSKVNLSIASKVALQVNCKLGGAGWTIDRMSLDDTMIIGIDTYHDSEQRGKSVVGIVASLNKMCTAHYTTWTWQNRYQEIGVGLHQAISEALNAYKRLNKKDCQQVVVYRDGVGDGQLNMVIDTELIQIQNAFGEHGLKNLPFAMVVVKKRISNRFFARQGNNFVNPSPGLVVDSEATRPMWYDFYLVSQDAREGTVTPTHFNVIYDSTSLTPDIMQALTYKQCHGYFNWTGPIRVPAPCQYAHKVAYLIGDSLHTSPDNSLKGKLFYL